MVTERRLTSAQAAVWGPNATDPEGAAKVTGFAKVLGSLFSEARLKELVELSAGNENKDKVKADAAFIVEQGYVPRR